MSANDFADEAEVPRGAPSTGKRRKSRGNGAGNGCALGFRFTDLGNAERFVAQHGCDLRFVAGLGWFCFDGKRWRRDDTGERYRRAKLTVRAMYAEAAGIDSDDVRKALLAWARKSESRERINAMVALAESDILVAIRSEDLDADVWLLNVDNGTVDLRTGELRPHRRDDLLTKIAPVAYSADATAPTFEAFLKSVFAGDAELIEFVRRFVGYALTGTVSEQILVFAYGHGSNGKSTLFDLLLAMLGSYAMTAAPGLLVARQHEAHPTERADLFGQRLVTCVEIGDGRRWNEELVKQLTGGDVIKARYMNRDFFEFRPTHKLLVSANHKPQVKGTDHAIWRRIRLLPFNVRFDGATRDPDLPTKLQAELPGVLRWAVEGCLAWQRDGMTLPKAVEDATAEYRAEMDVLGAFIEERCIVLPAASIKSGTLYTDFVEWTKAAGEQAVSQKALGQALTERGFEAHKGTGGVRMWRGIGLRVARVADSGAESEVVDVRENSRDHTSEIAPLRATRHSVGWS